MAEEEKTLQDKIHAKGFSILSNDYAYTPDIFDSTFGKIKVGTKTLEDPVFDLTSMQTKNPNKQNPFFMKGTVIKALMDNDYKTLREISKFYYKISGIYERAANFFATLYRFDWYVSPEVYDRQTKEEKVLSDFAKVLNYLDNSHIKKLCGEIALQVIIEGCYYGYMLDTKDRLTMQPLPIDYCRTRYSVNGLPAIEFNMAYFDTFRDTNYRMRILNLFPDEFKKGYSLFKQGKLQPDYYGATGGWYLLTPGKTIKFNFNNSDIPILINAIPALIDLEAAQNLDRRKQMQKLLKIIVQKLPRDKNGDLIFDVEEARDIHNNAVKMLQNAVGLDVLTTFADIEDISLSDKNTTTTQDDLVKVEREVFNAFGVSQNLFNTDGNLALEKSVLVDESNVRNLLLQFADFFDSITQNRGQNRKKYNFKFYMLETTQFNYKEMAKLYKEQTQIGNSKMLPAVALGQSQSFILNSAIFENEILHLSEIMIPPLMSSTMSSEDVLGNKGQGNQQQTQKITEEKTAGRPEKADGEKSDKTLANQESMN